MRVHPHPDRGHRQFLTGDLTAFDEEPTNRNIGQPVLTVIAEPDGLAVLEPNPPRALDLQKERVDRIINPKELETAPGKRAILDLRARIVRAGVEVRGTPVDRRLVGPVLAPRAVQLDLEIAGEQAFVDAVIGDCHRRKFAFEKLARSTIVTRQHHRGIAADGPPVADLAEIDAGFYRTKQG